MASQCNGKTAESSKFLFILNSNERLETVFRIDWHGSPVDFLGVFLIAMPAKLYSRLTPSMHFTLGLLAFGLPINPTVQIKSSDEETELNRPNWDGIATNAFGVCPRANATT